MLRNVSPAYMGVLASAYLGVKGTIGAVLMFSGLPLFFYELGVSTSVMQACLVLITLPWSMKGLIGGCSDQFPIAGYHKRWYARIAATALPVCLFVLVFESGAGNVDGVALILTACSTCIAIIDILFEGQSTALMSFGEKRNRGTALADSRLPDYQWGLVMIGTMIAAVVVGTVADTPDNAYRVRYAFAGCVPVAAIMTLIVWRYPNAAFTDDHVENRGETLIERDVGAIVVTRPTSAEWRVVGMLTLIVVAMIIAIMSSLHTYPYGTIVSMTILCGIAMRLEYKAHGDREALWGMCFYGFLSEVFFVDISAAISVFYTAPDMCIVDGPQFSLMFYTTGAAAVSGLVGAIVAGLKMSIAKGVTTRKLVQAAIVFRMLGSFADISVAAGWNRAVGIPDWLVFLFGDCMVTPTGSMVATIALAALTGKVAYKNRETMTYSIVASWQNLGIACSRIVGLFLMDMFSVSGDLDVGCNFDNYKPLLVLTDLVAPLFVFALSYALVPDV